MILYKHPEMKDIAFQVIKKFYIKEKDIYEVKVLYYLRLPESKKYECTNILDKLRLPKEKVKEWVKV